MVGVESPHAVYVIHCGLAVDAVPCACTRMIKVAPIVSGHEREREKEENKNEEKGRRHELPTSKSILLQCTFCAVQPANLPDEHWDDKGSANGRSWGKGKRRRKKKKRKKGR